MSRIYRLCFLPFFILFVAALVSPAVLAQVELSGQWLQKMQEDWPDRSPGPHIGDYTGMPINEEDRMRGDTWDAEKWVMVEHQCQPHPSDYAPRGPANLRIWSDADQLTQGIKAWHLTTSWMLSHRGDLYGWPAPSPRVCTSHLAGVFYRRMGGGRPENNNHPSERGMGPPQRARSQRTRDDDRISGASPSLPDISHHRERPDLSYRAIYPDVGLGGSGGK